MKFAIPCFLPLVLLMGGLELGVGVERLALLSFSWLCNYTKMNWHTSK